MQGLEFSSVAGARQAVLFEVVVGAWSAGAFVSRTQLSLLPSSLPKRLSSSPWKNSTTGLSARYRAGATAGSAPTLRPPPHWGWSPWVKPECPQQFAQYLCDLSRKTSIFLQAIWNCSAGTRLVACLGSCPLLPGLGSLPHNSRDYTILYYTISLYYIILYYIVVYYIILLILEHNIILYRVGQELGASTSVESSHTAGFKTRTWAVPDFHPLSHKEGGYLRGICS